MKGRRARGNNTPLFNRVIMSFSGLRSLGVVGRRESGLIRLDDGSVMAVGTRVDELKLSTHK